MRTSFFPLLTGTPYLTSHDAISSMSFRGFFLFASLNLLNANSSLVSVMGIIWIEITFKFHPQFPCSSTLKELVCFLLQIDLAKKTHCRKEA